MFSNYPASAQLLFSFVVFFVWNCVTTEDYFNENRIQTLTNQQQRGYDFGKAASVPPDASTIELIQRNGYPVETHEIITKDNYILTAHRIPYGKNSIYNKHNSKPPVFVLHGNLQSSADWVLNSRVDNCLGFVLADAGFDVWLGNIRGNIYSNKHLYLNTKSPAYWNYSMDEFGQYDIPATIDYILDVTQKPKLHYIGFSLGNTHFYLALGRYPHLSEKIALHISYGPSVFFGDFPLRARLLAPFSGVFERIQDAVGGFPAPPEEIYYLLTKFLPIVCNPRLDIIGLCRFITFLIVGYGPNQISREQMPRILGHLLTPTSLKVIIHGFQLMNNGKFTYYDYGPYRNLREYGQKRVPEYNLHQITAPIALIRSPNDIFANKKASDKLARNLRSVYEYSTVSNPEFTHLDFCYGRNANVLVYEHTLDLLRRFS